jgi:multidrug transporter EmrE-like cation transporter
MSEILIAFLIGIGLSIATVIADALIKNASSQNGFSGWHTLLIAAIIYGLTAFGWFFVMRKVKLSTIGALYGVSSVILLTFLSVFFFKEKISFMEIIGIGLAIISLIILSRFA